MNQTTQSARQPNSKQCCLNWVWSTITANTAGLIFADHWARKISNAIEYQQNMRGASEELLDTHLHQITLNPQVRGSSMKVVGYGGRSSDSECPKLFGPMAGQLSIATQAYLCKMPERSKTG